MAARIRFFDQALVKFPVLQFLKEFLLWQYFGFRELYLGILWEFDAQVKIEHISKGLEIATITLTNPHGATPPEFTLKWGLPSSDIAGYWSSGSFMNKTIGPDWGPSKVRSMLAREAPVISLFGYDDINRLNFSTSEVLNTVILSTGINCSSSRLVDFI